MDSYDVVVIGSGYGGAIPATRLAEAGMSVLLLERGKNRGTGDLTQSDAPVEIQEVIDLVIARNNVAFRTGKLVGGASINMDGAFFRMPQKSFEARDGKGRRYWPDLYSRAALDPYYEKAEAMMKIRQVGWDEVPKTAGLFGMMLDAAGASCELSRMNYHNCLQCGFCSVGCVFDRKMTLRHTYLPLAYAAGATLISEATVSTIEPSSASSGYLVSYQRGAASTVVHGTRVIVAGGGIHTSALLLRSKAKLPKLSPHVGKNFNNNGEFAFVGLVPESFAELSSVFCYKGMENGGLMSFHWYDEEGFTLHPGAGLEPTVLTGDFKSATDAALPSRSWGLEYKRFAERVYPHKLIAFSALGLADGHAEIAIDGAGKPDIVTTDRTAFDAYIDRLEEIVTAVGKTSGITLFPSVPRELSGTTSAHLLSACRMAESADDGVVDPDGQLFGYENLYCCDASAVPYSLAVNPALTISAIAERTAELIVTKG